MESLQSLLAARGRSFVTVLLSEVTPPKLAALSATSASSDSGGGSSSSSSSEGVEVWVQIACPRLSIDWGEEFTLPTLNSYEVSCPSRTVLGIQLGMRFGGGCWNGHWGTLELAGCAGTSSGCPLLVNARIVFGRCCLSLHHPLCAVPILIP